MALHRFLAALAALCLLPVNVAAQVTPTAFQASTPGWTAMSGASLGGMHGDYLNFDPDGPVVKVWDVSHPAGLPMPNVWNNAGFMPSTGVAGQQSFTWTGRHLGQVFGLAIDRNPDGPYIYAAETAIYGSWYNTDPGYAAAYAHNPTLSCTPPGGQITDPCFPGLGNLSDTATNTAAVFTQPALPGLFAFPATLPNTTNTHGGAVWRLSLKADLSASNDPNRTYELVALIPTNRMSLGQIAYNGDDNLFYVSNFADGGIYVFHNTPVGGPPVTGGFVVFTPAGGPPIDPHQRGQFAQYGHRIWGVQYNATERRLYYAVWNSDYRHRSQDANGHAVHNQIYSVKLDANGYPIPGQTRLDVDIPVYPFALQTVQSGAHFPSSTLIPYPCTANSPLVPMPGTSYDCYSQPVSDIAFDSTDGVMLLAERGERIGRVIGGGYDTSADGNGVLPHNSRILRYRQQPDGTWQRDTASNFGQYSGDASDDFAGADVNSQRADSSGGVDFGYGYANDANGNALSLDPAQLDAWVWNGSNSYRTLADWCMNHTPNGCACPQTASSGSCPRVYGLMGGQISQLPTNGGNGRISAPPKPVYFIDFDGDLLLTPKTALGDVEVNRPVAVAPKPDGLLKICKVAGPGVKVGETFTFSPSDHSKNLVSTPAGPQPGGYCRVAGSYPGGSVQHVTEQPASGFGVAQITVTPAASLVGQPNLAAGAADVSIVPGGVTEVTFTNTAGRKAVGYLEVCKTSSVAGLYTFNVDSYGTVSVPAGACSPPVMVSAGPVTIRETSPGFVLTACSAMPASAQGVCDTAGGVSTVTVAAGGPQTQTIATLTNVPCKGSNPRVACGFVTQNGGRLTGPVGPAGPTGDGRERKTASPEGTGR